MSHSSLAAWCGLMWPLLPCDKIPTVAHESWDSEEWEHYGVQLVTRRFGVDQVVRVPDQDKGDRGLDAFTLGGVCFQCYAPENEPLAPSSRATLQKKKINADLNKLDTNKDDIKKLLGETKLKRWVLLTPVHESADLVEYCNRKGKEVKEKDLPFIDDDFAVMVHDMRTYAVEHAALSQEFLMASDINQPPPPPPGINFAAAAGPHIGKMDDKLAKIPDLHDDGKRTVHRAVLLEGQFGGDALLDRYRNRMPEVASSFEVQIASARREMILAQAEGAAPAEYYSQVRRQLVQRFGAIINQVNAEYLAQKCISDWLQQCPLDFEPAP